MAALAVSVVVVMARMFASIAKAVHIIIMTANLFDSLNLQYFNFIQVPCGGSAGSRVC